MNQLNTRTAFKIDETERLSNNNNNNTNTTIKGTLNADKHYSFGLLQV